MKKQLTKAEFAVSVFWGTLVTCIISSIIAHITASQDLFFNMSFPKILLNSIVVFFIPAFIIHALIILCFSITTYLPLFIWSIIILSSIIFFLAATSFDIGKQNMLISGLRDSRSVIIYFVIFHLINYGIYFSKCDSNKNSAGK